MDREKQIEEMARDIFAPKVAIDGIDIAFASVHGADKPDSHFMRIAQHLYNAGYRKQSEVAKEIFEEIDNMPHHLMNSPYALALIKEINRLTEKLMLEIKADTVKKMQKKIIAKSEYGTINISPCQLNQIAKEMLEENNGVH